MRGKKWKCLQSMKKNSHCELFFFSFGSEEILSGRVYVRKRGKKRRRSATVFFFFKVKMKAGYRTSCWCQRRATLNSNRRLWRLFPRQTTRPEPFAPRSGRWMWARTLGRFWDAGARPRTPGAVLPLGMAIIQDQLSIIGGNMLKCPLVPP